MRATTFIRRGTMHDITEDAALVGPMVVGSSTSIPLESPEPGPLLAGVFDGVGGHGNGREAATWAAARFAESLETAPGSALDLSWAIIDVHRRLCDRSRLDPELDGMGTTVAVAFLGLDHIEIANVGDSQVYGLHGDTLCLLSLDDVPPTDPECGRITQCLGGGLTRGAVQPHISRFEQGLFRRLLLCSDGVTRNRRSTDLEHALRSDRPLDELWAFTEGSEDDATVVLVELEEMPGRCDASDVASVSEQRGSASRRRWPTRSRRHDLRRPD